MKFLVAPASSQPLLSSPVTLCLNLVVPFICTQVVVVLVRWDSRAGVVLVKETTITVCTIKGSLKRYDGPIKHLQHCMFIEFYTKERTKIIARDKKCIDYCKFWLFPTTNMPVSQQFINQHLINSWQTVKWKCTKLTHYKPHHLSAKYWWTVSQQMNALTICGFHDLFYYFVK